MRYVLLVALVVGVIFLSMPMPAHGQEPEPTPTPTLEPSPTPSYLQGVQFSTGNELLVQKTVTFGDVAIVVAVLVLAAVELAKAMVTIPRMWIKK